MNKPGIFGQYCPLAMSAEFLCQRWTMLILREVFFGSHTFNDIARGVPRMSRTLLSNRLKELVEIGILKRNEKRVSGQVKYDFTKAGNALEPIVMSMANWGQEWLQIEPSIKNVDIDFLMWDIRRNAISLPELPNPFIVHFFISDVSEAKSDHWLVYERGEIDLCHIDKGFKNDIEIEVDVRTLTKVWMGWEPFEDAIHSGKLLIDGPDLLTKIAKNWLGQSSVANIKKAESNERLNY